MKKNQFSEEPIISILKLAEAGPKKSVMCAGTIASAKPRFIGGKYVQRDGCQPTTPFAASGGSKPLGVINNPLLVTLVNPNELSTRNVTTNIGQHPFITCPILDVSRVDKHAQHQTGRINEERTLSFRHLFPCRRRARRPPQRSCQGG